MMANDLYQLLTLARSELARRLHRALVPLDLTTAQFYALEVIATSRGCIPSKCCALLGMDGGAFTRIIDKLEDMRLVERNRHPSDRRVVQLQVLPTGVELYASTRIAVTDIQEEFLKAVPLSDANKLRRLLELLLSDTDDHDRTGFLDALSHAC